METCQRSLHDGRSVRMPTYEYACEKCRKNFDAYQSMRDEPYRFCPKELCREEKWGKGKVKRLLGVGAGLIFKGSGFYITDYRSDSYKEAAKKEAPAATPSSDSGSGKDNSAGKSEAKGASAATPAKTAEAKPKKESTG
jgi:putative FmdB family regulatory protein